MTDGVPLARGGPGAGFPWPWSVYRWLDGRHPVVDALEEPGLLAEHIAAFVGTLRRDPLGALSIALVALPYWHTDPPVAEAPRHVIAEILAEAGQPGDRPGSGAGSWPSPCRGVTHPRPPPPRRRCRSFPWSAWP
ncbi:hypothetical protein [Streptomyces sp. ALI-76-A]|uniref:hypothetical protein n=1 Tax=Streptomyces sp. ALI-76-A TaxID=3025736 RepID=UPI00256EA57D|nr:hypothetical protein [Streptomyces sp. ALI-76-A]MDL5199455.1 hypothetical protein [Streptomyces sp. ALI-76-A]